MSGGKRPESSIAQSFAADLDSMFGLSTGEMRPKTATDDEIPQALIEKKQDLYSKTAELEELEAKLKATEERLAKSRNASPARQANVGAPRTNTTDLAQQKAGHPLAQKPSYPPERPPTGRENTQALMSGMPGHMPPPTPQEYSAGRDEYVVVDNNSGSGFR